MMKKNIVLLIITIFCHILQAQKIYIYGKIEESHIDSLTEYLDDVFLNNKKVKKIKIFCPTYQSDNLSNCKPLIVTKKNFRNEINSYYSSTIENNDVTFEFEKMNQIKNELLTLNENTEIQILDKCEAIRGRSTEKTYISNSLKVGNESRLEFVNTFSNRNAIVLLSFYTPAVNLTNVKLDKTELQFVNNSCNTVSMKKEVTLIGTWVTIHCKLKNIVINQGSKSTKLSNVNSNFTHPIILKKGNNEISIVVTYANNIKETHNIQIEYLGDEKINFITPAESGEVLEICQSNDRNAYEQIQIQFETRISPNLLKINIKKMNDMDNSDTKSVAFTLSNYVVEDVTSNEDDKIRKYCFYLNARDIFNQLVSTKGYGACLWPSETSYTIYFSLVDSAIRASKELNGIIIMDAGDEGQIKRPTCSACN
jgi:hypothetical protein